MIRRKRYQVKVADLIIQDLLRDEIQFETPVCRQIFEEMAELQQKGVIPDKDYFLHHSDPITRNPGHRPDHSPLRTQPSLGKKSNLRSTRI